MSGSRRYRLGFLNDISFSFEQVFDQGNIGDVNVLMKRAFENIRRGQEGQAFLGTSRYRAIVLTTPQIVRKGDDNNSLDKDHYQFRARVPELHSSIPDPFCYIKSEGADGTRAKRTIARHPIFVSDSTSEDGVDQLVQGDIVVVDFEKGPSNTRTNLGKYIKKGRFARFEGYETECDELVDDPPSNWCNLCTFSDPAECTPQYAPLAPPGSGGTTAAYHGNPVNVSHGSSGATTALGNTSSDAKSGPCSELYYEDQVGLGAGRAQVTPCCCGQNLKWGGTDTGANHLCADDRRGCHSLAYDNHAPVKELRAANPSFNIAGGGKLNCSTGQLLQYAVDETSLNPLVKPLWIEFLEEVRTVVGNCQFRYTSVRRSVKYQWVLYTGRQGLAHANYNSSGARTSWAKSDIDHRGIYIPSRPLGRSARTDGSGWTPNGHQMGMACDGSWTYPKDTDGKSTGLNTGWNGKTQMELAKKIATDIAGGLGGFSTAQSGADKYGIYYLAEADPPHWQMYYTFIDPASGEITGKDGGGQMTWLAGLDETRNLGRAVGKFYYGLHGGNACQWHEDFVDLPFDYIAAQCPTADEACLVRLGDPSTYHPSIVGAYALQNETGTGTVGPSGYPPSPDPSPVSPTPEETGAVDPSPSPGGPGEGSSAAGGYRGGPSGPPGVPP
jgi:hypothetical protein